MMMICVFTGAVRGGDGTGERELVPPQVAETATRERCDPRRQGMERPSRPHGHADPGLGRADLVLQVPKGLGGHHDLVDHRNHQTQRTVVIVVTAVADHQTQVQTVGTRSRFAARHRHVVVIVVLSQYNSRPTRIQFDNLFHRR